MFAVMWSEHCGYKYSRNVLAYFKKYKEAMEGDGHENAGIIDIGDGLGITMKVESHNHPSAVEPYQGAATGVGGIIRDIFTMGARPIAALNSLRFGTITPGLEPEPVMERNRHLFRRVVAGIGGYGNCVGVPTVAGEVNFHPRYSGNPLVNAMCVGVVPLDQVTTAAAAGVGNPVIYLGSATGKDGIHGATFASDALGEDNEEKRPNVQIGDPFAEKLLIEATLEALKTGAVVAIQDMGAAGLTCSTIEMSSKGGVGMEIDLDLVPAREAGMSGYELMLSESQERMLCVAEKGREHEVIDVFRKWGTHAVVIGYVTDGKIVRVTRNGDVEACVDATFLTDHCPSYSTPIEVPAYHEKAQRFTLDAVPDRGGKESLLRLLAAPNIASKRWVYEQYDYQVQTQTALIPGAADAAVLDLRDTERGIAVKIDGNARQVYLDPYTGGTLVVAEAARNVACTGAKPVAATDGLNFGNPQLPHVYWQFERSVKGIADACEALKTPVVSGNVSFYNESDLGEVLPTPLIGMLGVLQDAKNRVGMALKRGHTVCMIDIEDVTVIQEGLGASEYLAEIHGIEDGVPVPPDLAGEARLHDFLVECAAQKWVGAAHDSSEGGLAVALAEMCICGDVGVRIDNVREHFPEYSRSDSLEFGEVPGRVLLGVDPTNLNQVKALAEHNRLRFYRLGTVLEEERTYSFGSIESNLSELQLAFEGTFSHNMDSRESK
jgi:phosphoribosylformylglycinamidine synthase II